MLSKKIKPTFESLSFKFPSDPEQLVKQQLGDSVPCLSSVDRHELLLSRCYSSEDDARNCPSKLMDSFCHTSNVT